MTSQPKVFISYSWDSEDHKNWVRALADGLRANGVDVILDQYDCPPGTNFPYFMEQSLEKSQKTLLILTENYCDKADNRIRGVGYEGSVISADIYRQDVNQRRFIPILRSGDNESATPVFLRAIAPIDMRSEEHFAQKFDLLLKAIFDHSEKPPIGNRPDFSAMPGGNARQKITSDFYRDPGKDTWGLFFQKTPLKEYLGIHVTVNCNRHEHYTEGLSRRFRNQRTVSKNFVFFLSACLHQRPASLAKRLIYEMSEKGMKIGFFQDATAPGEVVVFDLKFGLDPDFSWIEYWKVVQQKFVTAAVNPEELAMNEIWKEKDRIAFIFRISEKKWEEADQDLEKHIEAIIRKFTGLPDTCRKYLLFFVFEFKYAHSIRHRECQKHLVILDALEEKLNRETSESLLVGHYKLFPPVAPNDVDVWFADVAARPHKSRFRELIEMLKTQQVLETQDMCVDFDMELVETMQEAAWKFYTRPRPDLPF